MIVLSAWKEDTCILDPNFCNSRGYCEVGANGNKYCTCFAGFEGPRCNFDRQHCSKLCRNNATCELVGRSEYVCNCAVGYKGKYCESKSALLTWLIFFSYLYLLVFFSFFFIIFIVFLNRVWGREWAFVSSNQTFLQRWLPVRYNSEQLLSKNMQNMQMNSSFLSSYFLTI